MRPNDVALTLDALRIASFEFQPVRPLSLWYVVTLTPGAGVGVDVGVGVAVGVAVGVGVGVDVGLGVGFGVDFELGGGAAGAELAVTAREWTGGAASEAPQTAVTKSIIDSALKYADP